MTGEARAVPTEVTVKQRLSNPFSPRELRGFLDSLPFGVDVEIAASATRDGLVFVATWTSGRGGSDE